MGASQGNLQATTTPDMGVYLERFLRNTYPFAVFKHQVNVAQFAAESINTVVHG